MDRRFYGIPLNILHISTISSPFHYLKQQSKTCYMAVEFHLPAFNIRIILNGIYSIDNSIVPFIKVFFRIVRHYKDTGIDRCTLVIKDTGDA